MVTKEEKRKLAGQKAVTCDVCGIGLKPGKKGLHFANRHPEYKFTYKDNGLNHQIECAICFKRVDSYGDLVKNHLHKIPDAPIPSEKTSTIADLLPIIAPIFPMLSLLGNSHKDRDTYVEGFKAGIVFERELNKKLDS